MSSIKDLIDEEKEAEGLLKGSEQQAEAILKEAKAKAGDLIRRAQSDDALVKELTERNRGAIAAMQAKIQGECQAKATETERLCKKNLDAAVKVIVEGVEGAGNER